MLTVYLDALTTMLLKRLGIEAKDKLHSVLIQIMYDPIEHKKFNSEN